MDSEKLVQNTTIDTSTLKQRCKGCVIWFSTKRGYGFIKPETGERDIFVHHTGINGIGYKSLAHGEKVEYEIELGHDKKIRAANVTGPNGADVIGDQFIMQRYFNPISPVNLYRYNFGGMQSPIVVPPMWDYFSTNYMQACPFIYNHPGNNDTGNNNMENNNMGNNHSTQF